MGPRSADLPGQIKQFLQDMGFSNDDIQIGYSKVCASYMLYTDIHPHTHCIV